MDSFAQKKAYILEQISLNSEDNPDDSPKGTIDEFLKPLIATINGLDDFVTTSSCSGRVSVFLEGEKGVEEGGKVTGKGGGKWLFVSHDPKEIEGWEKKVFGQDDKMAEEWLGHVAPQTSLILFKYEAMILHVQCRSLLAAQALYSTAMGCGFRESGIGSNNNVAIRISLNIGCPIGYGEGDNLHLLVPTSYLQLLTQQSRTLFTENFRRMDMLHRAIEGLQIKKETVEETKEQRAQRKRQEGLRRQREKMEAQRADSTNAHLQS
ncbi:tRNA wybutosine-synthesizing protein [Yarrowia lipolytica]|jgi:tRNA wybutosine-synthesizing protein 3|uniref:tRNA wybutosine-synthesizing protein 3 n=3 Tax=Yarrowia lipolytica TaxID=4952 RepID=Q6C870_YARLI|nr:YALI0D22220p [Yarrowia lipolytica CLIB122]KAB8285735.1 tRNA wybutosine-synthesizing protein [Yarrowia lipolytica]KAE8172369.1 tRNA wybutosine-synthesizing protein [Yarrowia lipolytica]KAJ8054076.1 tRNA wybutosine-synthesizing protein [Yarrowia lipolytica]QNP98022.1 tRNA wybutosine-synthesizing protein 3 [Yarrowia lipolytica]RDW26150.1 tRNA wybutosine-synthesizing protein [Yarrowia lipolytica]|eukprot:XP_503142.1 YALI0D22220p [Yarrowia lipolytica CLIB122]